MTSNGIITACCSCDCMKKLMAQLKDKYPEIQVSHSMCKKCIETYYGKDMAEELNNR